MAVTLLRLIQDFSYLRLREIPVFPDMSNTGAIIQLSHPRIKFNILNL